MHPDDHVIAFRGLQRDDFPMLAEWLARPHVQKWWKHRTDPESIEDDFGDGVDGDDPVEYFVVTVNGTDCAFIQRCQLHNEDEWHATLQVVHAPRDAFTVDYFIADASRTGHGLGTEIIRRFLADCWARYPDASCSIVDVDPANPPSWRALEKNGYVAEWEGHLDVPDERDAGLSRVFRLPRPSL